MFNKIKWNILKLFYYLLRIFPIDNKKIMICTNYGRGYGDSAKYICEYIYKYNLDYKVIWAVSNYDEFVPDWIKKVKYKSISYYYNQVTAKIWIDNCRKYLYERKRNGQYYIQTWHGDLGMKKIEKDAVDSLDDKYIKDAINDSKMIDYFISGNKWFSNLVANSFWYKGEVNEIGSPRRDIFYTENEAFCNEIKKKLNIEIYKKIMLYAPTFRAGGLENNLNAYNIDFEKVKRALEIKMGGEWVVIVKFHPNLVKYFNEFNLPNNVRNVSYYSDMQELLLIADCVISDYSSSIFEYSIKGKPSFIFATDFDEYKKDRDLYFEFNEIPFSVSKSNEELIYNIKTFKQDKFEYECDKFYNNFLKVCDTGHASKDVCELISEIIENK